MDDKDKKKVKLNNFSKEKEIFKKKDKITKSSLNYYKITTFILLALFLFLALFNLFQIYSTSVYDEGIIFGQQNALNLIFESVNEKGFVSIPLANGSLVLIEQNVLTASILTAISSDGKFVLTTNQGNLSLFPEQRLLKIREDTILQILKLVRENGHISLYDNVSEVVLVPFEGEIVKDNISLN